jgi:hypothetical protein
MALDLGIPRWHSSKLSSCVSCTSDTHTDPPPQCLHYYTPSELQTEARAQLTVWKTALRGHKEIWRCGIVPLACPPPSVGVKQYNQAQGEGLRTLAEVPGERGMATGSDESLPPSDGRKPTRGWMAAFINHTYDDLTRNLFTPAPYLRSFSANLAYYLFRIRTSNPKQVVCQVRRRSEYHPYAGTQSQWNAPNTIPGQAVPGLPRKEAVQ